jgi:hypothetical protein
MIQAYSNNHVSFLSSTAPGLDQVGRIVEILHPHKVFLDASRANEPIKNADTSSLVVRPASTGPAERLLTHDGACAFFVVVDITSGITEFIGCGQEGFTVRGKAVRSAVLLVRHWGEGK